MTKKLQQSLQILLKNYEGDIDDFTFSKSKELYYFQESILERYQFDLESRGIDYTSSSCFALFSSHIFDLNQRNTFSLLENFNSYTNILSNLIKEEQVINYPPKNLIQEQELLAQGDFLEDSLIRRLPLYKQFK